MNFNELIAVARAIWPDAEVDEQADGNIVIVTNLHAVGDDTTTLIPFENEGVSK